LVQVGEKPRALGERRLDRIGLPWVGRRTRRTRRMPRYPVVFCHGMLIICQLRGEIPAHFNYFLEFGDTLRRKGGRALFPQVAMSHGVSTRARQLREQILAWTDEPVNLVCHSLGGLDARYLVSHLNMAERVRSVTTVSTPHHGTYVADWVCAHYQDSLPLMRTLEMFGLSMEAIRDCQPAACRAFNASTPDAPGVSYFSYGAAVPLSRVSPMLRRCWSLLTAAEGPNDGLVSVRSARWGEYRETLAVDHFAQSPDGMYIHPRETFDSVGFFTRLLEDLAWRGF
jgi:triacylglycerol lipase